MKIISLLLIIVFSIIGILLIVALAGGIIYGASKDKKSWDL